MFDFLGKLFPRRRMSDAENPYDAFLSLIKSIQPDKGVSLFSPDRAHIEIRISYPNINEYSQFLKRVIDSAQKQEGISVRLFGELPKVISLSDWFVDSQGRYLNPVNELQTFQTRTIAIVELYKTFEAMPTEIGERSINILRPLLNQIKEITHQLLAATTDKTEVQIPSGIKSISEL